MAAEVIAHDQIRDFLLASLRKETLVQRDLWSLNNATYPAFRRYLSNAKSEIASANVPKAADVTPRNKIAAHIQRYTFTGVKHIFDQSDSSITAISFANVRSDLLAFANQEGDMWIVNLQNDEPTVIKAQKVHQKAISCMDWSFDNSHLLTAALDGSLCVFSVADGTCSRSRLLIKPTNCCKFFPTNPNIAILGNACGEIQIFNCSTGAILQHYKLARNALNMVLMEWDLQVTAIECTSTHVFVGDSAGYVHMYKSEMQHQQINKLTWMTKFRAAKKWGAVLSLHYKSFCGATRSPFLFVTCQDTTVAMLNVNTEENTLQKEIRCLVYDQPTTVFIRPSIGIRAAMCPLSCIDSLPLFTMGSEDTQVYIYTYVKGQKKPLMITPLQGHGALVMGVSWSFDESLLASADANGHVIVWKRNMEDLKE